jgi:hypothetical protein
MTALLLYSYCCGIYSSRRSTKAYRERVDFMSRLDAWDFRTVSDFRTRHLEALGDLFKQVLHLCEKAGLVKPGHVALDGTKIKANASKHKAMSYVPYGGSRRVAPQSSQARTPVDFVRSVAAGRCRGLNKVGAA